MLCERLSNYDVVVDCRSESEYNNGHIKGSVLMPIDNFHNTYDELSRDDNIAIYCRSGARAFSVVDFMQKQGFKNVTNIGGINSYIDCL